MNPLDFSGKTILVTGASNGIGKATAVYLSRLGARIVAVGRNEERLAATMSSLEGPGHLSYALDLGDAAANLPMWMKSVASEAGSLHGLVHSAGTIFHEPLRVLRYERYQKMVRVNLDAALMLSKGLRQKGVRDESGSAIVFLSSIAAIKGYPALAGYAGTKGALISLTRTLAHELAGERVRVNCICPGLVRTRMLDQIDATVPGEQPESWMGTYPLGIGEPEDVAYAVAFLLAPAARWITGTTLVLDGGCTA